MSATVSGLASMTARDRDAAARIVGRTVADVFLGPERTVYLILDDGTAVVCMCDPEGNGPGALHLFAKPPSGTFLGIVGGR